MARARVLLVAMGLTVTGCDSGVEFVPLADLSGLMWGPIDAAVAMDLTSLPPDLAAYPCATNADCLGIPSGALCCNGLCARVTTDPTNCGACGHVCPPVPNGMPGCALGNCFALDADGCLPGRADCDRDKANGCEVSLLTSPEDCGACGHVCISVDGKPTACSDGQCHLNCPPGLADCNNVVGDACETSIYQDASNCGGCGTSCKAPAHAAPTCLRGTCSFVCALGYGDCDGRAGNGCEVEVGSDVNHCGHCGNKCPPNTQCVDAKCQ